MNHGDGGMDHGGHGGMDHGGGMGEAAKCSMHMLWNSQIIDTCVVFPQWHIRSNTQFVASVMVIVGLGIFYEWLRLYQKTLDIQIARSLVKGKGRGAVALPRRSPSPAREDAGLLTGHIPLSLTVVPVPARILRAALYGMTVFLSFFLMLVFMTYNSYLIVAVVVGAAIGHYLFGGLMDAEGILAGAGGDPKGMACH